jgi:Ca2+-binding EF-hand superfamily protein
MKASQELKALESTDMQLVKRKLASLSFAFGKGQDPHTLFSRYDRDKSGELDFTEFCNAVRKGGKLSVTAVTDRQLQQWFSAVDIDNNGAVSIYKA